MLARDESYLIKQVLFRSAPKKNPDYSLPEFLDISLDEFADAYPDWLRWLALDRRYPPTVIRQQPRKLLDTFIYLDMLVEKMSGDFYEKLRKENEKK